jgi:hypothetical protein
VRPDAVERQAEGEVAADGERAVQEGVHAAGAAADDVGEHLRRPADDQRGGVGGAAAHPAAPAVDGHGPHAVLAGVEDHGGGARGQDGAVQAAPQAADEQVVEVVAGSARRADVAGSRGHATDRTSVRW